jgi:membrane-associated protease RseP (regulator of RpoE activity)
MIAYPARRARSFLVHAFKQAPMGSMRTAPILFPLIPSSSLTLGTLAYGALAPRAPHGRLLAVEVAPGASSSGNSSKRKLASSGSNGLKALVGLDVVGVAASKAGTKGSGSGGGVVSVVRGSPAGLAGVLTGDVLVSVDGAPLKVLRQTRTPPSAAPQTRLAGLQ